MSPAWCAVKSHILAWSHKQEYHHNAAGMYIYANGRLVDTSALYKLWDALVTGYDNVTNNNGGSVEKAKPLNPTRLFKVWELYLHHQWQCGACRMDQLSNYKPVNCTAPCSLLLFVGSKTVSKRGRHCGRYACALLFCFDRSYKTWCQEYRRVKSPDDTCREDSTPEKLTLLVAL